VLGRARAGRLGDRERGRAGDLGVAVLRRAGARTRAAAPGPEIDARAARARPRSGAAQPRVPGVLHLGRRCRVADMDPGGGRASRGFLPLIWASLAFGWGLTRIWTGLSLFMVLRLVAVIARWRSGHWAVTGAVRPA